MEEAGTAAPVPSQVEGLKNMQARPREDSSDERRKRYQRYSAMSEVDLTASVDFARFIDGASAASPGIRVLKDIGSVRDDEKTSSIGSPHAGKFISRRDAQAESIMMLDKGMNADVKVVPSEYTSVEPLFGGKKGRRNSIAGPADIEHSFSGAFPVEGGRRLSAPSIAAADQAFTPTLSLNVANGDIGKTKKGGKMGGGRRDRGKKKVHPSGLPLSKRSMTSGGGSTIEEETDEQVEGEPDGRAPTSLDPPLALNNARSHSQLIAAENGAVAVRKSGEYKFGENNGEMFERKKSVFNAQDSVVSLLMQNSSGDVEGMQGGDEVKAKARSGEGGTEKVKKRKTSGGGVMLDPFSTNLPTDRAVRRGSMMMLAESIATIDQAILEQGKMGKKSSSDMKEKMKRQQQRMRGVCNRCCIRKRALNLWEVEAVKTFLFAFACLPLAIGIFWGVARSIAPSACAAAEQEGLTTGVLAAIIVGLSLIFAVISTLLMALTSWAISRPLRQLVQGLEGLCSLNFMEKEPDKIKDLQLATGMLKIGEVVQAQNAFNVLHKALFAFSKYVPPDVVQSLVKAKGEAVLAVTPRKVTIFFSDIASFTTYAESLEQEELVKWLASYFSVMCEAISSRNGVVGEFVGDAIMAYWNGIDGIDVNEHEYFACDSALRQLELLVKLRELWEKRGWPKCHIRCGLHTDIVLCGNIGSPARMKYGLVGDGVNLASRLEGLCKVYNTKCLISESVASVAKVVDCFVLRPLDRVIVKVWMNGGGVTL